MTLNRLVSCCNHVSFSRGASISFFLSCILNSKNSPFMELIEGHTRSKKRNRMYSYRFGGKKCRYLTFFFCFPLIVSGREDRTQLLFRPSLYSEPVFFPISFSPPSAHFPSYLEFSPYPPPECPLRSRIFFLQSNRPFLKSLGRERGRGPPSQDHSRKRRTFTAPFLHLLRGSFFV